MSKYRPPYTWRTKNLLTLQPLGVATAALKRDISQPSWQAKCTTSALAKKLRISYKKVKNEDMYEEEDQGLPGSWLLSPNGYGSTWLQTDAYIAALIARNQAWETVLSILMLFPRYHPLTPRHGLRRHLHLLTTSGPLPKKTTFPVRPLQDRDTYCN